MGYESTAAIPSWLSAADAVPSRRSGRRSWGRRKDQRDCWAPFHAVWRLCVLGPWARAISTWRRSPSLVLWTARWPSEDDWHW